MKHLGIYVHVPFCRQKCPYCDFYSTAPDKGTVESYMKALGREIRSYAGQGWTADTVYFGGGTPTRLPAGDLVQILQWVRDAFLTESGGEYTVEANPDSVSPAMLKELGTGGFNRISFGMQSSAAKELQALGRSHSALDLRQAVRWAQGAGFANISADIMLGIPYQTKASLEETIRFLEELDIQHVSAYLLKMEEGTPFYQRQVQKNCPGEEQTADLYLQAVHLLEEAGFIQYEISNFAKPGFKSRHNLKYWRMEEYLGFGPSAHSFLGKERFAHGRDLGSYCAGQDLYYTDRDAGTFEEYGMLRLRLTEGLDIREAEKRFHRDGDTLLKKAAPFQKAGLVKVENTTISLTAEGFLLSNSIIAALVL